MSNCAVRIVKATDIDHAGIVTIQKDCRYEELSVCPICNTAVLPRILNVYYALKNAETYEYNVFIINFCPKCRRIFICQYDAEYNDILECLSPPISVAPRSYNKIMFSEPICKLSPCFVTTYAESIYAESLELMEICGPGYRKALEFLVKDYLCHLYPQDEDKIKSELLGNSINRIENSRVKTLAQRCAWIGNDETHYVKKHDNRGLEDIKRFINATLHYIESELAFEEAESIEPK